MLERVFLREELSRVADELRPVVDEVAAGSLDGDHAAALAERFVEVERLAVAGRLPTARAVPRERWEAAGFRSAGSWMAAVAGVRAGPSIATAAPAAEEELVDDPGYLWLAELGEECRRVEAAVVDAEEGHRRLRRERYRRSWTDRHGAVRLTARLAPEDHAGLLRGHLAEGEVCEIRGLGPIPVSWARRLAGDGVLKVLVTQGVDVVAVAHGGPTSSPSCGPPSRCETRPASCPTARSAGTSRSTTASPGPPAAIRLASLARLCRWHHFQKSHLGDTYRGGPGTWEWIRRRRAAGPPSDPP